MSLFYNRDRNIELGSTLTEFDFNPAYGSTISFTCKKNLVGYNNYTFSIIPITLNNIIAECNFNFIKEEQSAQKMIDFFESQSGTGAFAISDSSSIYHSLTGFADDFSIGMQTNNLYNVSLKFSVERNSSMLNWKSMSFVNYEFTEWQTGQSYSKYQPVYFEINSKDKTRNFFYATQDHVSSLSNGPCTNFWSQSLFYENDYELSVQTTPKVERNSFKNSFSQRIKSQENIHSFVNLQLSYKSISDAKLKSILHFLENSLGYKRFQFDLPKIYNKPKIFFVDSWQHTWKYKDSHDLTINLIEDPLGILNASDTPDIVLGQTIQDSSITINATAKPNNFFVIDFTGQKNALSSYSNTFSWGTSNSRSVKFYKDISGLSVSGPIRSIDFYERASLISGNFQVTGEISFEKVQNIDTLILDGSTFTNFDLSNQTGIKNISAQTSSISNVTLTNIDGLTGLNLGNSPLTTGSFFNVVQNLSLQQISSGSLKVTGVSPKSGDLRYINDLDYYSWSIDLKDFNLPFSNLSTYFNNAPSIYWFQTQKSSLNYNLNWLTSIGSSYKLYQEYSPQQYNWFYPDQNNKIGQRLTYSLNQTLLTGTWIRNINANNLSCFCVAKFNTTGFSALVNFDDAKKYGLFIRETGFYFIDGSNEYLLASGLAKNTFYHLGFIRNSTNFSGFVNGRLTNTDTIINNTNNYLKLAVGSASGSYFLNGNIADLLVVGGTGGQVSFNQVKTGEFFSGYCAKYGIQTI